MSAPEIELIQFLYSPYNEKARWALDLKGIKHRRRTLLPGPHMPTVKKLTGQTATPVLRLGGEIVWGSARILEAIERAFPTPTLFPSAPEERRRAAEIEKRFDQDWTPRARRFVLADMLPTPAYFAAVFARDESPLSRLFYRLILPLAAPLVRKGNGIAGEASIVDGVAATDEAFDFVARESAATGYLVGDRFTVADLAAAASLAPLVEPPHPDMKRPEPYPPKVVARLARWRSHPGRDWVLRIYREHRPPPAT